MSQGDDKIKAASDLEDLMQANVETVTRIEQAFHRDRSTTDVFCDAVAGFCGSMAFLYFQGAFIGLWLSFNTVWLTPKPYRFDPPPFNYLNLLVSTEAILLSTTILISQNRQRRVADQRNHLDLQINMLAEQEASQMLTMMRQIMAHLGMKVESKAAEVLEQTTDHEQLFMQIQANSISAEPADPPSPES